LWLDEVSFTPAEVRPLPASLADVPVPSALRDVAQEVHVPGRPVRWWVPPQWGIPNAERRWPWSVTGAGILEFHLRPVAGRWGHTTSRPFWSWEKGQPEWASRSTRESTDPAYKINENVAYFDNTRTLRLVSFIDEPLDATIEFRAEELSRHVPSVALWLEQPSFTPRAVPPTFAQWRAQHDVGIAAADDDGDGLDNGLEFFFGLDPRQVNDLREAVTFDARQRPTAFRQRRGPTAGRVQLEASADLTGPWEKLSFDYPGYLLDDDWTSQSIRYYYQQGMEPPQAFFRFRWLEP
jgi:hypothetical protein